jgi:hypothetical protein
VFEISHLSTFISKKYRDFCNSNVRFGITLTVSVKFAFSWNMSQCTLVHGNDGSEEPDASIFSAEKSVDVSNRFRKKPLPLYQLHGVTSQKA